MFGKFHLHREGFRVHCCENTTPYRPPHNMNSRQKPVALLCLLAILGGVSACTTGSLQQLRRTTPTGNAFNAALSQLYLAFSESEAKQYDWWNSKYFAEKGLKAVYGHDTQPENLADWDIDAPFLPELTTAREELMKVLTPEHTEAQPDVAAHAQFFYDCWVEQQQEAWQEDDITSCREGFYRSVKTLIGTPEPVVEVEPMIFSSSYIVFFAWNQALLSAEAIGVIDTVASDLLAAPDDNYEVILNGHADSSGNAEYNLKLSQKRAEAVKAALVQRGIAAERIQYYAFGESDPRIPTADGVRERANRRVEIFFNQ
jgi:OmpA-OmpF porin, OOP family